MPSRLDDGTGSYGQPPPAFEFTDVHKPKSPTAPEHHPAVHLTTGPAVNPHSAPLNARDDATGSYGQPPPASVGVDDRHKAHMP